MTALVTWTSRKTLPLLGLVNVYRGAFKLDCYWYIPPILYRLREMGEIGYVKYLLYRIVWPSCSWYTITMSISSRRIRRVTRNHGSGISPVSTPILRIACGQSSPVSSPTPPAWLADTGYSGGSTASATTVIDMSGVTNPAPMSIYQNERWIDGTLTYTLSGLTPGNIYALRLHFAELVYTSGGQRVMNFAVNGTTVVTGYDIFVKAGGINKACVQELPATADGTGTVTLTLTAPMAGNDPKICGIEVSGNVMKDDTPTGLNASPSSTYVTLTWNAPVFPTGTVQGYNVYQNGVKINNTPVTAMTYSPGQQSAALSPSTNYTFKVATVISGVEKASASKAVSTTAVSTGIAWPLRVSSNKRYLEDQNGKAFLVTAETSWTMLTKLSVADCKWVIDKRKSQGFNTIMTNIQAFNPGSSGPRGGAFAGTDITQWNESYFQGVDQVMAYAASQGVHIMLNGIWLSNWGGYSGNSTPSPTDMATFGTKVGARYKNFPNVSYFVGGDEQADGDGVRPQIWPAVKAYGDALHAAAPSQVITYHPQWNSYDITSGEAWLSYNSYQLNDNTNGTLNNLTLTGRNLSPVRPIFCIEPPYDPDTAMGNVATTPLINRQNQWGALLGGAMGVSYGGPHDCWYAGFGGDDNPDTYGPLNYGEYDRTCPVETGNIPKIMSSYPWYKLVPNNGLVSNGGSNRGQNQAALAADGTLFVAYTQGSVTVNTSGMQGTSTGQWYSPATGLTSGGSFSVSKGSGQYCSCPTGGDGVLVITS